MVCASTTGLNSSFALSGWGLHRDQPEVIEKIVTHLGLWACPSHAPPHSVVA